MKIFKRIVAVLALVMLVFAGWVYMASMGVERTALNSNYYRELVNEKEVIYHVHGILQENIKENITDEMSAAEEATEIPEDIEEKEAEVPEEFLELVFDSLGKAFDSEWLEEQAIIAIDDMLAFIKREQESPTAVIGLEDVKERFRQILIDRSDELGELGINEQGEPPEETVDEILKEMDMPDQIALAEIVGESELIENIIPRIQTYRFYFLFVSYIIFALLLGLVSYTKGLSQGIKWFGITVFASGLTFLIGIHIARAVYLTPLISGVEDFVLDPEVSSAVVRYTILRMSTVPIIFSGLGLVLLVISRSTFLKNRS